MYVKPVISPRVMLSFAWRPVLFFAAYATAVSAVYHAGYAFLALPFTPVGTLGMAVAILVGFHNDAALRRWHDGLGWWIEIQTRSQNLAVATIGLLPAEDARVERVLARHLSLVHALRRCLRDLAPDASETSDGPAGDPAVDLVLSKLALEQVRDLREAWGEGLLSDESLAGLVGHIEAINGLALRCLDVKERPLPRQLGFVTRLFVWVFALLLPMGLLAELGWGLVPLATLLGVIFTTLEQVGRYTENPFANHINDVPIDAITRDIEREVAALLGQPVPPRLEAVAGVLM